MYHFLVPSQVSRHTCNFVLYLQQLFSCALSLFAASSVNVVVVVAGVVGFLIIVVLAVMVVMAVVLYINRRRRNYNYEEVATANE